MYAKITKHKAGMADYLLSGKRKDSKYTREEKDEVSPLFGDLFFNREIEKYLETHKNFAHNYLHITLSFSQEDMQKLNSYPKKKRLKILKEIAVDYVKHHTTGNNLEYEVICYAEVHDPIIKTENEKRRFLHIHLQIMNYNPVADTSLSTAFANTSFIDNALEMSINKKYNFTIPSDKQRYKSSSDSYTANTRKQLQKKTESIGNMKELEDFLDTSGYKSERVEFGKSKYINIVSEEAKTKFKFKGLGFTNLSNLVSYGEQAKNRQRDTSELKKILHRYYEQRITYVENRKSKRTKTKLGGLTAKSTDKKEDCFIIPWNNPTPKPIFDYLPKIKKITAGKHKVQKYKHKNQVRISDEDENIKIEVTSKGIMLFCNNSEFMHEAVKVILELAKMMEWNLLQVYAEGSRVFMSEVSSQVNSQVTLLKKDHAEIDINSKKET